ncbi:MAG: tRNA (N6-isopentenyl adenosine(37)-C2)-methylthiotransferase MiaB, partial [Candidatus Nealsonbacteria bacterium RBG_13_37_56]
DSEKIAEVFKNSGHQSASNIKEADLVIVNMCSVRQSAVDRVYGLLLKFQKLKIKNLKFKIILTGCILKKDRKKFEKIFDYVLDIKNLSNWPRTLRTHIRVYGYKNYLKIKPEYSKKFTAYVPIMTGCNNFCSYCVVPYTRGREISRPSEEIICEVKKLIKKGIKEIWLLGQNVNSYKGLFKQTKPTPQKDDRFNCESSSSFSQLLRKINEIPGKFWIRFTSSHPKDFSNDIIKAMKNCEKITPYLNLPVQAGDDKVLKSMNRPYTIAQYKKLLKKVRKEIPNICLSTDVIVGFPGETKKQFENTVKLFKEIKYDMAYINRYSPRSGTAGAKLIDNVPAKEKKARENILNEILKKTALENNKKYLNKIIEVLITNNSFGKTETNKTVKVITQNSKFKAQNHNLKLKTKNLIGCFIKIKITDALAWGLKGEYDK